jgi:hypothetical protein
VPLRRLLLAALVGLATTAACAAGAPAKTKVTTLHATMTGAAEVPAGDPGGSAKATITLDVDKRKVCWTFTKLRGVSRPNAAHIHQGNQGRAGAIAIPFGGAFSSKGCQTKVDRTVIKQVRIHPGRYYVNIHSAAWPAGAVRGQLTR